MLSIRLTGVLSEVAGCQCLQVDGVSVREALADTLRRHEELRRYLEDDSGHSYESVRYFLNGDDIRWLGGFTAPVQPGDELTVVYAVVGG
jgi:molybdopterin converting factor small subunit